jgi:hypothetical protein
MKSIISFVILLVLSLNAAELWNHKLWLGNGGFWRSRFSVEVSNQSDQAIEGKIISVKVGDEHNEAPLTGVEASSLRVVNNRNTQLLFNIWQPDFSSTITDGEIPAGAILTLPLVCDASEKTSFTLYFDNPAAWKLADFLHILPDDLPLNGDFELGSDLPLGWFKNEIKPPHRFNRTDESPYSGRFCLKQIADPALSQSWSGLYRTDIKVAPGAECELRVRVRTENLKGYAGWFVHVGNSTNGQMLNRHASIKKSETEWHELMISFTVPPDATIIRTGSLLRGSGTAWFDDLRFESDKPVHNAVKLKITTTPVEHLDIQIEGTEAAWIAPPPGIENWNMRFPINILPSADAVEGTEMPVFIETALLKRGIHTPIFRVTFNGEEIETCRLTNLLLFRVPVNRQKVQRCYLYVADSGAKPKNRTLSGSIEGSDIPSDQLALFRDNEIDLAEYKRMLASDLNLIRNPDFEKGEAQPDDWYISGQSDTVPGVVHNKSSKALFNRYSAECRISESAKTGWHGWRQTISVKPSSTYLFGGWMATENFAATGHLHVHLNSTQDRKAKPIFLSAGTPISGNTEWTPMFSAITIPRRYDSFSLHLTANCSGMMRHDGFLMAECLTTTIGEPETRPQEKEIKLWQVNPIVKLFRETLPPVKDRPIEIHLARNESEPLQLALRSGVDLQDLKIEISAPSLKSGSTLAKLWKRLTESDSQHHTDSESVLNNFSIGRVDFVPIDTTSCYSNHSTPEWEFKYPQQRNGSDGWPGWWPDPIFSTAEFRLSANRTQPLWITFNSNTDTAPGEYQGEIRIKAGTRTILNRPFKVTVWDFDLPENPEFSAIYDVRFRNIDFTNWRNRAQAREKILRFLAAKKLSPDTVQSHIPLKRDTDGKVTCDFTAYDKACQLYFDELKFRVSYMPHNFNIFGWGHPPRKFLGEEPYEGEYPYQSVDRSQLRPQYKQVYQEALRLYWNHIKARGRSDNFILYISDEPHFSHQHIVDQMRACCDMIHAVDPAIRIYSSTWRHCPEWDDAIDVWGIGHYGCFSVEQMQRQRKIGNQLWFTTDGQMCTDTPLLATERMLPHYAFKYGVDVYEFWGVSWYTHNPWEFGWHTYINQASTPGEYYHVRYPNGDGYLIYPPTPETGAGAEPVTSIRIEAARDGVEDWSYLRKLSELAERHNNKAAHDLLAAFLSFCEIPNAGGRYSGRNMYNPDQLMRLRIRVGETIESLEQFESE